jgi:hypothetical protein
MTERRRPTLADRFIHRKNLPVEYMKTPVIEDMQRKTRAARKFVLDEDAAARVAEVVRDIPELLLREADFARAPFPLTWIEFPHWRFYEALHGVTVDDPTADQTVGYLIDGGKTSVVSGGTLGDPLSKTYPGVLQFNLNTAWSEADYKIFAAEGGGGTGGPEDEHGLDIYLWGSTINKMDTETISRLRQCHSLSLLPLNRSRDADDLRRMLDEILKGSVGELRNIIAILLLLNRPTVSHYKEIPASRGWMRNKNIPYAAHTAVTIDLNAVPTLRLIGTPAGEGVAKRRHEVRGHFCHDADARDFRRVVGCLHDWIAADEYWSPLNGARIADANHWVCDACGGKRWWRAAHERGDATRGYVSHDDYDVTAKPS